MGQTLVQRADVTNAAFAARIGVGHVHISHLRGGRRRPSIDLIVRISEVLPDFGVEKQVQSVVAETYGSDLEQALIHKYGWRHVVA